VEGSASQEDYGRFFDATRRKLVGQAYFLTGDLQEAQDLVQEVLLRAWQHWDRVSTLDDPFAWAQHVLHNLSVSYWRRQRIRRVHARAVRPSSAAPPSVEHLDVVAAVSALPRNQRSALVLRAVGGLSNSEIASELGTSADTVRVWLSRARRQVAASLAPTTTATPKEGDSSATP